MANAIGNPDAESAGFSFLATVLAPAETSVFLEYGTAAETGRFLIGKIPGTRDQKELLVYAIEDPKSIGNLRHFKQCHVRSARTVSYTHLDVYKRQMLRQIPVISAHRWVKS